MLVKFEQTRKTIFGQSIDGILGDVPVAEKTVQC